MTGTAIAAGSSTLHGFTVPDNQTLHQPHYTPCSAPPGEDDPEPSRWKEGIKETLGPEATPLPANLTLNLPSQRFSMLAVLRATSMNGEECVYIHTPLWPDGKNKEWQFPSSPRA